jgi:tetratricopeptide (TPR) repeat protein
MDYHACMTFTYLARFIPTLKPAATRGTAPQHAMPVAAWAGLLCAAVVWATPAASQTTPTAPKPTASAPAAGTATAPPVDSSKLDSELFYQLMLGEMNVTNGDAGTGFSLLLDAARKTNDARLYERALDIALAARSGDAALQASRAWRQAQPKSVLASERLFQVLVALSRLPESVEPLRSILANTPVDQRGVAIGRTAATYARVADKKLAATTAEQALGEYITPTANPVVAAQAWTAIGRLRLAAADVTGALDAARLGQTASPVSEGPPLLALDIMEPKQPLAETYVKRYLETDKPRAEIRMVYARVLLDNQRYNEATQQAQIVTRDQPTYPEAWLVLGTLQLQDNQLPAADTSLKRYVELAKATEGESASAEASPERQRGLTQAYLALAQVAEKRNDFALAESWIAKIDSPQALASAQNRRASILAKQGKMDEARKLIRALPDRSDEDVRMKLLSEVELLRNNKQYKPAYDLLQETIAKRPQDYDLLYDQATLAEKLQRFDEMERLLRQLIAAKPDSTQAYNALGYSLADRSVRLPEAKKLIEKALELSPGDPFITDSLGWAEFRMGNTTQAIQTLQKAYQGKADAEIAAHLGEVYWATGQRSKALAIWKEGMLLNPENETLLQTLKRLRVKL